MQGVSRDASGDMTIGLSEEEILGYVREIMEHYPFEGTKSIASIRQCTSSFFVLLYNRIFASPIADIDRLPNTPEKKKHNMWLVLQELRKRNYNLDDISADEVVKGNVNHIGRLVMLFTHIMRSTLHGHPAHAPGLGDGYEYEQGPNHSPQQQQQQQQSPYGSYAAPPNYRFAEVTPGVAAAHHQQYHSQQQFYDPQMAMQQHPQHHYEQQEQHQHHQHQEPLMQYQHSDPRVHDHDEQQRQQQEVGGGGGSRTHSSLSSTYEAAASADAGSQISVGEKLKQWYSGMERFDTSDVRQRQERLQRALDERDGRGAGAWAANDPQQPSPRRQQHQHVQQRQQQYQGAGWQQQQEQQQRQRQQPQRPPPPPPFLSEDPMTRAERRMLASHPHRAMRAEERDRKIARLAAARRAAEAQEQLQRQMRRHYHEQMGQIRDGLRESLRRERAEVHDVKRQIREENDKYVAAYQALMASAANGVRAPLHVMTPQTLQLAEYFSAALCEGRRMSTYLRREYRQRSGQELVRYADTVSAWQGQPGF